MKNCFPSLTTTPFSKKNLSIVTIISWLPLSPFVAPSWKGRRGLEVWSHYHHHQYPLFLCHHLGPHVSCPLPPTLFCPALLIRVTLSPKEGNVQEESLARGSYKAHPSFCLPVGTCVFLSCSPPSPRVWSRVATGLLLLPSSTSRTPSRQHCLCQLSGARSAENSVRSPGINVLFPGKRGMWWPVPPWTLVLCC